MAERSLMPDDDLFRRVDAGTWTKGDGIVATDDREAIRRWASERHAEPATGEATQSGPAVVDVQDGGAGIRFNFPGAARFRPISWDEWFQNFAQHRLMFLCEQDVPGRPHSHRYRLVPKSAIEGRSTESTGASR